MVCSLQGGIRYPERRRRNGVEAINESIAILKKRDENCKAGSIGVFATTAHK
jgi:hypothetical protein